MQSSSGETPNMYLSKCYFFLLPLVRTEESLLFLPTSWSLAPSDKEACKLQRLATPTKVGLLSLNL